MNLSLKLQYLREEMLRRSPHVPASAITTSGNNFPPLTNTLETTTFILCHRQEPPPRVRPSVSLKSQSVSRSVLASSARSFGD